MMHAQMVVAPATTTRQSNSGVRSAFLATSAYVFAMQIIGAGIRYLSLILFAHWMSKTEFGVFVYWMALIPFLAQFGCLGTNYAALRFIPTYLKENDGACLRGFIRFAMVVTICVSAVIVGALTLTRSAPSDPHAISTAILMILVPVSRISVAIS